MSAGDRSTTRGARTAKTQAASPEAADILIDVMTATGQAVEALMPGITKPTPDTGESGAKTNGPTLIVDEKDFRIVRLGKGDGIRYVLEVLDEPDALGCERWRPFNMDSKHLRQMLGFMVKMATKESSQ